MNFDCLRLNREIPFEQKSLIVPLLFRVYIHIDESRHLLQKVNNDLHQIVYENIFHFFVNVEWETMLKSLFPVKEGEVGLKLGDIVNFDDESEEMCVKFVFSEIFKFLDGYRSLPPFTPAKDVSVMFFCRSHLERINLILAIGFEYASKLWPTVFQAEMFAHLLSFFNFSSEMVFSFVLNYSHHFHRVMSYMIVQTPKNNTDRLEVLIRYFLLLGERHFLEEIRSLCIKHAKLGGIVWEITILLEDIEVFLLSSLCDSSYLVHVIKKNYPNSRKEILNLRIGSLLKVCIILASTWEFSLFETFDEFEAYFESVVVMRKEFSTNTLDLLVSLLLVFLKIGNMREKVKGLLSKFVQTLWNENLNTKNMIYLASCFHSNLVYDVDNFVKKSVSIHNFEHSIGVMQMGNFFPGISLEKDLVGRIFSCNDSSVFRIRIINNLIKEKIIGSLSSDFTFRVLGLYVEIVHDDSGKVLRELENVNIHLLRELAFLRQIVSVEQIVSLLKKVEAKSPPSQLKLFSKSVLLSYVLLVNDVICVRYKGDIIDKFNVVEVFNFCWEKRNEIGEMAYSLMAALCNDYHNVLRVEKTLSVVLYSFPRVLSCAKSSFVWIDDFPDSFSALEIFEMSERRNFPYSQLENKIVSFLREFFNDSKFRFSKKLCRRYLRIWERLFCNNPMKIAKETFKILGNDHDIDPEKFHKNVYLLFKIRMKHIFEIPSMMKIFLQILTLFSENRRNVPKGNKSKKITSELALLERSAIVQVLFELGKKRVDLMKIVGNYIHQIFIENPEVAKVVHFQGYDKEWLSLSTKLVESMHICTNFVVELMESNILTKRVFGVVLSSYLSKRNNTFENIHIAKCSLNQIRLFGSTGKGSTENSLREALMCNLLKGVVIRLSRIYPFLKVDIIDVLTEIWVCYHKDDEMREQVLSVLQKLLITS